MSQSAIPSSTVQMSLQSTMAVSPLFAALPPLALALPMPRVGCFDLFATTTLRLCASRYSRLLHRLSAHLLWYLVPVEFFPRAFDDLKCNCFGVRPRRRLCAAGVEAVGLCLGTCNEERRQRLRVTRRGEAQVALIHMLVCGGDIQHTID